MPYMVLEKDTMCILPVYIYCAGRHSTSHLKSVRGAGWILEVIYHVSTLLCTHLTWRIVCFLNILLKLQKETKGGKKKEKRMHCVARVSIKFKAIFRAHRFVLIVTDDHQWSPNEEVIIHWWTRYEK